jgi:SnoaL-like polyketide cyclase
MTAEENKVLVRRLVEEAVNPRNPDVLDEVARGEFALAARRWAAPFRDSFPDFQMEIVDLVAGGGKVAAHFRCSGTHLGEWMGHPPRPWLGGRSGQRWRCRSLRFLIRLPQVAMSHQAPARLCERS